MTTVPPDTVRPARWLWPLLLMLTGCIGKNGGGWAHYVGQEKCRPMTGWFNLANALDWSRPPRTMIGTGYWYMHTDQWRTDGFSSNRVKSPLSTGVLDDMHTADAIKGERKGVFGDVTVHYNTFNSTFPIINKMSCP